MRLEDASGRPTPALLSIRREPSGQSVDLGGDPLRQRESGRLGRALPGPASQRPQWRGEAPLACDGGLEVALPPGAYGLHAGKGLEYVPVRRAFEIRAGQPTELALRLERFADLPRLGWWSGDDHVHVTRSDPALDAAIFLAAMAEDVHVVNALALGTIQETAFPQRGFGEQGRARSGDYAIVPGQEEPRTHLLGHVIGLDIAGFVRHREDYFLYDRVLRDVREQGGLTGYAHWSSGVGREGARTPNQSAALDLADGLVDFLEVLDADARLRPQAYYDVLSLGFRLPATAGSDFPFGASGIGDQRTYVHVGEGEPFSADRWFEGLRAGRTFVSQGPLLDFRVDGALPGAVLPRSAGDRLSVRAVARGHPGVGAPRRLALILFGEAVREAASDDPQRSELAVDWELPVVASCWLLALVEAHNGAVALSSPVYVTVGGRPTRDPARFVALVAERLAGIERLRGMLEPGWIERRAEELSLAGRGAGSREREELEAWQASRAQLIPRLDRARARYQALRAE